MGSLTLYPYQETGAEWLSRTPHAILGDQMGLGKSAQVIRALDTLRYTRALVICPASLKTNWVREFKKFSSRSWEIDAIDRTNEDANPLSQVVSYDYAMRNQERLAAREWDAVIADEAHYLKEPKAKRTGAVLGARGLIHRAKCFWALTGTPAPNHAAELWTLLYTFGVTPLSYEQFVMRYCNAFATNYGRFQITGTKRDMIPELKVMLAKVMLRRLTDDVLDLPPFHFGTLYVDPAQVRLAPDTEAKLKEELLRMEEALGDLSAILEMGGDPIMILTGLAQSVSTLRRYSALQKVESTAEVICEEFEARAYEKIIIFAIHHDAIELLRERLAKFRPAAVTGKTPNQNRQAEVDRFQKDPRCQVFLGNIMAAGTGLTLTAANHVLFLEQDWVPGNNAQAASRARRIGQGKPVFVRTVCLRDSIDEKISGVIARKTRELLELLS